MAGIPDLASALATDGISQPSTITYDDLAGMSILKRAAFQARRARLVDPIMGIAPMRKRLLYGSGVVLLILSAALVLWQGSFSFGDYAPVSPEQDLSLLGRFHPWSFCLRDPGVHAVPHRSQAVHRAAQQPRGLAHPRPGLLGRGAGAELHAGILPGAVERSGADYNLAKWFSAPAQEVRDDWARSRDPGPGGQREGGQPGGCGGGVARNGGAGLGRQRSLDRLLPAAQHRRAELVRVDDSTVRLCGNGKPMAQGMRRRSKPGHHLGYVLVAPSPAATSPSSSSASSNPSASTIS